MSNLKVRKPAVAGSFYPAEKQKLAALVDFLLQTAPMLSKSGRLKILIVPHAGLEYSGSVAAAGFKQLTNQKLTKIILLGASHQAAFDFAALPEEDYWETPLGKVAIDKALLAKLAFSNSIPSAAAHAHEHSLEIELPFLQRVLSNFKIAPILLGQTNEKTRKTLAEKIAAAEDNQTLLVVSSDLSHYPPAEIAQKVDQQTLTAILRGQPEEFKKTLASIENAGYPSLVTAACGQDAIESALWTAQKLNLKEIEIIKYAHSGEIIGEKNQVVGYGAVGFWQTENKSQDEFEKEALQIARKALEAHLSGQPIPFQNLNQEKPRSPKLFQKLGAFVTLHKNGHLRGCIGEFEPKEPLYRVIQKMAIAAAEEDPRFPKVLLEELKDIKIEISVLSPLKKIDDWRKIRLGKDGVVIQMGNHAGTFLPQVATETGWSLEEFLSQLCVQKAGLPPHSYRSPQVNLFTFQVQILAE